MMKPLFRKAAIIPADDCDGKRKIKPGKVFGLCPVRHIMLLAGSAITGLFFLLRDNRVLMNAVSEGFVRPYHRLLGRICNVIPWSAAELFYAVVILAVLAELTICGIRFFRKKAGWQFVYRSIVSLLTCGAVLYGGYCLLWGVYYYSDSFAEKIGLETRPVAVEELETVTKLFADYANDYSGQVMRDDAGVFTCDTDSLLARSATLYTAAVAEYPELDGPALRAKPMVFSRFMSWINFTGFFFPFTGEANLNMDAPLCLLPATVAHELAHQRGVSGEDEANFVAVLAGMSSNDTEYIYSTALLAYIHLGNALYEADYDRWLAVYMTLNDAVQADLQANNAYWEQYETKAAEASEAVYTGFLQSYGEERGMRSYGACVDLLVAYYGDGMTGK